MKIKSKLVAGSLSLVLLSLLLVGLAALYIANSKSTETIRSLTESKLQSTLELKKAHIEAYLEGLRNQFQLMAKDQNSASAGFHFSSNFDSITQSSSLTEAEKRELQNYVKEQFLDPYKKVGAWSELNQDAYFAQFDENAWLLQYHYIFQNSHPVGEKDRLESAANEFSAYSSAHSGYHLAFAEYAARLGFGDIYLIDPDGRVAYSLKKGFEFATSLVQGPFANSGLHRAFKKALEVKQGELVFEDFSAYPPLMNAPVAFIATPLIKFNRVRGVLAVQAPIDTIDRIMTSNYNWANVGLGETGEAYLLGADSTLRNTSRLNREDFEGYLSLLEQTPGNDAPLIERVRLRESGIGLHRIANTATEKALNNERGFVMLEDEVRGKLLAAFAPIEVEGFNWAIISEMASEEAFASADGLAQELSISLLVLTVVTITIATVLILLLARSIFRPIESISERMSEIASGQARLDSRLNEKGDNEIADFARSFNIFVSKLANVVEQTGHSSAKLAEQSKQLALVSESGTGHSVQLNQQVEAIIQFTDEIVHGIQKSADAASAALDAARSSETLSDKGKHATQQAVMSVKSVEEEIERVASSLQTLEQEAEEVANVLSVIDAISEQTNLLALNAAIEAARAGDSGRGFAVVADEVRSLSHKIQNETLSIKSTLDGFKKGAKDAVDVIRAASQETASCAQLSDQAGETLTQVVESSNQIAQMNQSIAEDTAAQNALVGKIVASINETSNIASESTEGAVEIERIGSEINRLAQELASLVSEFSSTKKHQR